MLTNKKIGNSQEGIALLRCIRLPGRLNTAETAILLGFQEHDIAPLVSAKLLTPLGKPASNAPKYFASVEVQQCIQNRDWLDKATRILAKHWQQRNDARRRAHNAPRPKLVRPPA